MILLDTHALIWWLDNPRKLSPQALKNINNHLKDDDVLVSSISVWEIAILVKKKKLELDTDIESWLDKIYEIQGLKSVAVDNEIAFKSVNLPWGHTDPADRIIVATASILGCPLITKDPKIRNFKFVKTIW